MIQRTLRNKSQIISQHQIQQFHVRKQKKHKTTLVNKIQAKNQEQKFFFQNIIYSIIDFSSNYAQNINSQLLNFQQTLNQQISITQLINCEIPKINQLPQFEQDIQPLKQQKFKVQNKDSISKVILPKQQYQKQEQVKSEKQQLHRLRKQYIAKYKICKEKRQYMFLKLQEDIDQLFDYEFLNVKLNGLKKKDKCKIEIKTKSSKIRKNNQENKYYDYNGQVFKITNDIKLKPVKMKNKQVSISILQNNKKQQTNPIKTTQIKYQRLSQHNCTNSFKNKYINSQTIENYMLYTFRTNKGVNLNLPNQNQNSNKTNQYKVRLPGISKKQILL